MAPETSSSADKRIIVVDPQKPFPLIAPAAGASMGALLTLPNCGADIGRSGQCVLALVSENNEGKTD